MEVIRWRRPAVRPRSASPDDAPSPTSSSTTAGSMAGPSSCRPDEPLSALDLLPIAFG
jgi:hypothetical protein